MLKHLMLLQTASALALALALPLQAQEATTEEATEAPAGEATTEAPAGEAATEAPAEVAVPEGEVTDAQATEGPDATAEGTEAAEAPTRDTVIATVNGTDITLGELVIAAQQLPPQYQQLPPDVLFPGLVDQLVQQELLAQSATGEPAAVALALQNQRRTLLATAALQDYMEGAVTEEEIQAAYDARFADAEPATEWNASHILVATEEEAQAVIERLNAGEDFAAVAQEVSTDTGSGAQGGELGWFGPGMMVPEFEEGVAGLEPGATSGPIQSQFGFHVIRLNETRPQEVPSLEQVRPEIEGQLQQEAVEARLAELEAQGEVTRADPVPFDPAILGNPAFLED